MDHQKPPDCSLFGSIDNTYLLCHNFPLPHPHATVTPYSHIPLNSNISSPSSFTHENAVAISDRILSTMGKSGITHIQLTSSVPPPKPLENGSPVEVVVGLIAARAQQSRGVVPPPDVRGSTLAGDVKEVVQNSNSVEEANVPVAVKSEGMVTRQRAKKIREDIEGVCEIAPKEVIAEEEKEPTARPSKRPTTSSKKKYAGDDNQQSIDTAPLREEFDRLAEIYSQKKAKEKIPFPLATLQPILGGSDEKENPEVSVYRLAILALMWSEEDDDRVSEIMRMEDLDFFSDKLSSIVRVLIRSPENPSVVNILEGLRIVMSKFCIVAERTLLQENDMIALVPSIVSTFNIQTSCTFHVQSSLVLMHCVAEKYPMLQQSMVDCVLHNIPKLTLPGIPKLIVESRAITTLCGMVQYVVLGHREKGSHATAEKLVKSIYQHLLDQPADSDKEERDHASSFLLTFTEDCLHCVSQIEFPLSEIIVRAIVNYLVHSYLNNFEDATKKNQQKDRIKALVVDVLSMIAVWIKSETKLCGTQHSFEDSTGFEQEIRNWFLTPIALPPEDAPKKKKTKKHKEAAATDETTKETAVSLQTEDTPQLLDRARCIVFHTLLRRWKQDRFPSLLGALQALCTEWSREEDRQSQQHADNALVKFQHDSRRSYYENLFSSYFGGKGVIPMAPATTSVVSQYRTMYSLLLANRHCGLCTDQYFQRMLHTIVATFMSSESGPQTRRHVVVCIRDLLEEDNSLFRIVWGTLKKCINDPNATVRESVLQLLHTCIKCVTPTYNGEASSDTVRSMVYNVLQCTRDKSFTVARRALVILGSILSGLSSEDAAMKLSVLKDIIWSIEWQGRDRTKVNTLIADVCCQLWFPQEANTQLLEDDDVTALVTTNKKRPTRGKVSASDMHQRREVIKQFIRLATTDVDPPFDSSPLHPFARILGIAIGRMEGKEKDTENESPEDKKTARTRLAAAQKRFLQRQEHLKEIVCEIFLFLKSEDCKDMASEGVTKHPKGKCMMVLSIISSLLPNAAASHVTALSSYLTLPEGSSPNEDDVIVFIHACKTLISLFESSAVNSPWGDVHMNVITPLTKAISRHVGAYSQKVLLVSMNTLAASVSELSSSNFSEALKMFYGVGNGLYVRLKSILEKLNTPQGQQDPNIVSYALRFLFLFSQFLRKFRWDGHVALKSTDTSPAPNLLCQGNGILYNAYQVVSALTHASIPQAIRSKVFPLCLRTIGSLCITAPTTYLPQCEGLIRHGLTSSDQSVLIQALFVVSDFLTDEEERVEKAAASGGKSKNEIDVATGMTPWVVQRFYKDVLSDCLSNTRSIRSVALDIIVTAVRQSVVAPNLFVDTLLAMTDEPKAVVCWEGLCERFGDAIASKAVNSVALSYIYHARSVPEGSRAAGFTIASDNVFHSIHTELYNFLSKQKKRREEFLSSTVRLLHTERGRAQLSTVTSPTTTMHYLQVLRFIAECLIFLPFHVEEEIIQLLDLCTTAIGMVDVDSFVTTHTSRDSSGGGGRRSKEKTKQPDASATNQTDEAVVTGLSTLILFYMKTFLRKEYGFTGRKLKKYADGQGVGSTSLPCREGNSPASEEFHSSMEAIQKLCTKHESKSSELLKAVCKELTQESESDCAEIILGLDAAAGGNEDSRSPQDSDDGRSPPQSPRPSRGPRGSNRPPRKSAPVAKKTTRENSESDTDSSASSSSDSEDSNEKPKKRPATRRKTR